ncbi:MAG: cysteine--tRNA ligase [archaeon]|nr:cysteine--tRNA ligase [archaeon]
MKVYNTATRKEEEFKPTKKGEVGMYVCGPTVYGPGHIGHARTYTAFDIIRRYLEYKDFKVNYVVNITDVHDDMIKEAGKQGITIFALADKNIELFMKDLKELGIKEPTKMPRVTQHIKEIIYMVERLQEKGVAYETDDGVYFAIEKFSDYGKLGNVKVKKSVTGTRVETDKYDKENPMDFALWKKSKEGEPSWPSPWGAGRPGWHIECSAMSTKYLGTQFDIHGGAVDLVFPHHENEIAQSEACFGKKPFVKYWLHAGFLNVRGEKMSKSLGNFITIPELLEKFDPKAFRYFISTLHYRSRIDFNDEAIAQASKNLEKWNNTIQELLSAQGSGFEKEIGALVANARKSFISAMDDDFNLPNAWAALYDFQSKLNSLLAQGSVSKKAAKIALGFLEELNSIFGFFSFEKKSGIAVPKDVLELVKKREDARAKKNFAESDRLRDLIKEKGYLVADTAQGQKISKA